MTMPQDPHADQPVYGNPVEPAEAPLTVLGLHGRGAGARDVLGLAAALDRPSLAYLAPDAFQWTWYPGRFTAPLESNEPYLSSALRRIDSLLAELAAEGVPPEKVLLLGFSQGACLSLEYVARNPRRYAGVAALSGGLIGPRLEPERYPGGLEGTPIFLGCSDRDPHIPLERVQESSRDLERQGAEVTEKIYPGMPHTVVEDELEHVRAMIDRAISGRLSPSAGSL